MRRVPPPAFTLIEILATVAAIAILAAIAIPNFLEAQVRSKVTRQKVEFVVVAEALEAYYADHFAYPPNLEPFHPAPGRTVQPVSRIHLPLAAPPVAKGSAAAPTPPPPPGAVYPWGMPPEMVNMPPVPVGEPFAPPPASLPPAGFTTPTLAGQPVPGVRDPMMEPGMMVDPMMMVPGPFGGMMMGPAFGGSRYDDRETSTLERLYLESFGGSRQVFQQLGYGGGRSQLPAGGKDVSSRLAINGLALCALTTPIAYMGHLPVDTFNNLRGFPIIYFNYSPYDLSPDWSLPAAGGISPHYLLASWGPDCNATILDPYLGFFEQYDPTNGTVSNGDIFSFDGVLHR